MQANGALDGLVEGLRLDGLHQVAKRAVLDGPHGRLQAGSPVDKMTGTSRSRRRTWRKNSSPSISGIETSLTIASNVTDSISVSAIRPLAAVSTLHPRRYEELLVRPQHRGVVVHEKDARFLVGHGSLPGPCGNANDEQKGPAFPRSSPRSFSVHERAARDKGPAHDRGRKRPSSWRQCETARKTRQRRRQASSLNRTRETRPP